MRRRSVAHFIGELEQVIARFPGFEMIQINDDEFIRDTPTLYEFCQAYRQAIDIPFLIVGFEPPMATQEHVSLLVDAGLKKVCMGIQTGSVRTLRFYRRPIRREQILKAAQTLHQFIGPMDPPGYDLIIDNPWESEADQLETLSLMLDIPKPYEVQLYSLTLYPGTELYERGKQEGLIQDEKDQIYQRQFVSERQRTYINGLFSLIQSQGALRWLLAWLMRERVRRLNWVWLPYLIHRMIRIGQLFKIGWRAALRGDWKSIKKFLRLRFGRRPQSHPSGSQPARHT